MALLSVDKKVRYPDNQLEKPQRMQKSIAPPVRAPDFHQSNNQSSPVEESRRWKKPSVEFHQDGTRLSVLLSARRRSSSPSTELPCLPATVGATPFRQGKS
jgi:hypothetical protein